MKLTKLSIMASVAALALTSAAFAAQPGYFAGVNLGYGDTRAKLTNDDKAAGVTIKKTGIAYGINGGYNFNNYVGVEGQLNKDASAKYSLDGATVDTAKFYDLDVLADGYLPLGNAFDLVGKAGLAYTRATAADAHESFYRPKLAAGVMYTVNENVSVSATYSRIFGQGNPTDTKYLPSIDVAAISVDYLF